MSISLGIFCLFPQLTCRMNFSCLNVLVFWKWHKGANERAGKVGFFNHHFSSFIPGPLDFRGKLVGHWTGGGSDISFHCSWNQVCSLVLSVSWCISPRQGCRYFGANVFSLFFCFSLFKGSFSQVCWFWVCVYVYVCVIFLQAFISSSSLGLPAYSWSPIIIRMKVFSQEVSVHYI